MKQKRFGFLMLIALITVFLVSACSSGNDTTKEKESDDSTPKVVQKDVELNEETPLYVNEKDKTVRVYATVNGKYLTTPTRHGLNWVEGKYGDQAVLKAYANPLAFYEALNMIGGTPAVAKGGDASKEFEETADGKVIKGDTVKVTITWDGADKEYDINEVMVDSTGKELVYKYGGNYDAAADKMTGCFMCFDSCPVGITSNSNQAVGTFENGKAEFHGNPDVLPEDGTPVYLTYSFE